MRFFHGTYSEDLEVNQVLRGRGQDYEDKWGENEFYQVLEKYRPDHMIAHKDAVFLCAHPDDIDRAGGGTTKICEMQVLGDITRHDLNWSSEISNLCSFDDVNEEDLKRCAENYWNGIPYSEDVGEEPLWEYLTTKAKIISIEDFEIAFTDEDIQYNYTDEDFLRFKQTLKTTKKLKM